MLCFFSQLARRQKGLSRVILINSRCGLIPSLLISLTLVFDPSSLVLVPGVPMRPVNYAALVIPLVFAIERNRVAYAD